MKLPKHANSIIYIISLLIPFVLTAILVLFQFIAYLNWANNGMGQKPDLGLLLMMAAPMIVILFIVFMLIPLLTYAILHLIQIYRVWSVINDGRSRMTPGEAIGYLFIPFYNIYWIFQVWGGFPADYNAFVDRYRLNQKVPFINESAYQVFPVFILLTCLIITVPVLLIYFAVLLNKSNIAIDNLRTALAETQPQFAQQPAPNIAFQPQI